LLQKDNGDDKMPEKKKARDAYYEIKVAPPSEPTRRTKPFRGAEKGEE